MPNNTPFSSDRNPDLTQTIRSVIMNEAKYAGVERRAKSGQQQRATKGSSGTEYNHGLGEYRPAGEEDRYYAKQRAEAAAAAAAAKAKKTTTNESVKYTELLESVLLALCEELELDPNELMEAMRLTPARSVALDREEKKSLKSISKQRTSHTQPTISTKTQKEINHAQSVNARVDAIRTGASKQERHRIGAVERSRRTDK